MTSCSLSIVSPQFQRLITGQSPPLQEQTRRPTDLAVNFGGTTRGRILISFIFIQLKVIYIPHPTGVRKSFTKLANIFQTPSLHMGNPWVTPMGCPYAADNPYQMHPSNFAYLRREVNVRYVKSWHNLALPLICHSSISGILDIFHAILPLPLLFYPHITSIFIILSNRTEQRP